MVVVARGRTVAQGTVAELRSAAARATSRRPSCASPMGRRRNDARAERRASRPIPSGDRPAPDEGVVDRLDRIREWVDALRDRRTLAVVLLSSVLMGPLVLVALSGLLASLESRAERREVVLAGAESAPTLVNYIARQGFTDQAGAGRLRSS